MICLGALDAGIVAYGMTRSGAGESPFQHLFEVPSVDSVDDTTPIQVGDLFVIGDLALNNSTVTPTLVIPTGFTQIGESTIGPDAGGRRGRFAASYKILTSADIGAIKTGMAGSQLSRKACMTFRMSRPVQSVTVVGSVFAGPFPGNAFARNLTGLDVDTRNALVISMGLCDASIDDAELIMTPDAVGTAYTSPADAGDAKGGPSATRSYYTFTPIGVTASNVTFDMADAGDVNQQALICLSLT